MKKLFISAWLCILSFFAFSQCTIGNPNVGWTNDAWTCYGYLTDGAFGGTGAYTGFYEFTDLSFDTSPSGPYSNSASWSSSTSPSTSSAWAGCGMLPNDNHSYKFKRMGVPSCGSYTIDILKNNSAQLWIDGIMVWEESQTVADQGEYNYNAWSGYLDEDSEIEYRVMAGTGTSRAGLVFTKKTFTGSLATFNWDLEKITVNPNELSYSNVFANGFKTMPSAVITSGSAAWSSSAEAIQLTTGGNQTGTMSFTPATTMNGFVINYDMRIPAVAVANGISFNYGNFNPATGGGEGGFANGLSVCFRTVAIPDAIDIKWNGTVIGSGSADISGAGYFETTIEVTAAGYVTVKYGPNQSVLVNNLLVPEYASTNKTGWKMAFSGKTAALSANTHGVDDINLYATDHAQYQLNGGAWQSNNVFNDVVSGLYTVNVRNADNPLGCTNTLDMVLPNAATPVNATLTATNCTGMSVNTVGGGIVVTSFEPGFALYYESVYVHNGTTLNNDSGYLSSSTTGSPNMDEFIWPMGTTTVTYTFSAMPPVSYTVVVNDGQTASIIAPADVTVCNGTIPNLGYPIYNTSGCGGVVANNAPSTYPIGNTTVTWTVIYADGDVASATQIVTVNANQDYYIDTDGDGFGTANPPATTPVYLSGGPGLIVGGFTNAGYNSSIVAQGFTVFSLGPINLDIAVAISQCDTEDATGARLEIVPMIIGQPDLTNVIGFAEVPAASIPNECSGSVNPNSFVHFILYNINLNSLGQYAIVIRKTNPSALHIRCGISTSNIYSNGFMMSKSSQLGSWSSFSSFDLLYNITQYTPPGTVTTCNAPAGYSLLTTDCNDAVSSANPAGTEICGNGIDEDCSGADLTCIPVLGCVTDGACNFSPTANTDDGSCILPVTYYLDTDADGWYATYTESCTDPGAGYVTTTSGSGDCNNNNAAIHPQVVEICNATDDNCDGLVDNGAGSTWYYDGDADGFGTLNGDILTNCSQPNGFVANHLDCNDANASINPNMSDLCNGVDLNCDGAAITTNWFLDVDGDNYMNPGPQVFTNELYNGNTNPSSVTSTSFQTNVLAAQEFTTGNTSLTGFAVQLPSYMCVSGGTPSMLMYIVPSEGGIILNNAIGASQVYATEMMLACSGNTFGTTTFGFENTTLAANTTYAIVVMGYPVSGIGSFSWQYTYGGSSTGNAYSNTSFPLDNWDIVSDVQLHFNIYPYHVPVFTQCTTPGTGYVQGTSLGDDCNDAVASIHVGATEICGNGTDEDCSGSDLVCTTIAGCLNANACNYNASATVSDNSCILPSTFYQDLDQDGFGNPNVFVSACAMPANYSDDNLDCNDNLISVSPDGVELCDNLDNDCNGLVDDEIGDYYAIDADGDGFGSDQAIIYVQACSQPAGYSIDETDCDDNDSSVYPGATETCGNNIDDDCANGDVACAPVAGCTDPQACNYNAQATINDGSCIAVYLIFIDLDGDGFGDAWGDNLETCNPSIYPNYVTNDLDCDAYNAAINPNATEVCNGSDDNCNGVADEGVTIAFYLDADGDGFGNPNSTLSTCVAPVNYVSNNSDCDDQNEDANPSMTEVCNDLDDDCDGQTDEGVGNPIYADADNDGFGNSNNSMISCFLISGYVLNSTDCNDNMSSINPQAIEVCGNSVDEDCSGADLICPSAGGIGDAVTLNAINIYNSGTQSLINVNMINGSNTIENPGEGLELWFKFTATTNAARIALQGSTAVLDDNELSLYATPQTTGLPLIPLVVENDVTPSAMGISLDGGNETMFTDQLVVGQQYYVCVRNTNATPGSCKLNIARLLGSENDIMPYTNYTGIYNNTCQNFKAKFRNGAAGYVVNKHNELASFTQGNTPDWIYAMLATNGTGTATSVCQLGKITSPNLTNSNVTIYTSVDVTYILKDAFGNSNTLLAKGGSAMPVVLTPEADLNVRTTDRCPVYKSLNSSVATNRSICGASLYNWEITETLPNPGLPVSINGAANASRLMQMSAFPAIEQGKTYDVRIRVRHLDGVTYTEFGENSCVRTIGAAGMQPTNNETPMTIASNSDFMIYPNPSAGENIHISITNPSSWVNLKVADASGRVVSTMSWNAEEMPVRNLNVPSDLANGMYMVTLSQFGKSSTVRMMIAN